MLAPQSVPAFGSSDSTEDAREKVKAVLAKIRKKAATGRLKADSTLFKLKQKLTQNGCTGDAARRARYLEEDKGTPEEVAVEE